MSWEIGFMLSLLAVMLALFVWEKIPPELTAMAGFAVVLAAGLLKPEDGLAVFSNAGPITIGAMFIISAALEKCGAIQSVAGWLNYLPKVSLGVTILALVLCVAAVSAFINNTAVVIVFMPVVLSLARRMETSASKLLIPLSYASMLGGSCTLVGTSTNLLVSSMAFDAGVERFGMFELAGVGLPLLAVGTLYLMFLGPKLLPERESLRARYDDDKRDYIVDAYIAKDSPLVGSLFSDTALANPDSNARVLELLRRGVPMRNSIEKVKLREGDQLVLALTPSDVPKAQSESGLDLRDTFGEGLQRISYAEAEVVEGIVGPDSDLIGKTLMRAAFYRRYFVQPIGINRRGESLHRDIDRVTIEHGDTFLLLGAAEAIEQLQDGEDLIVLDRPTLVMPARRKRLPIILGVLVAVIVCASSDIMPIAPAALIGTVLLMLTRCITLRGAFQSIHWPILMLIFSMLGVGAAMESTGTSAYLAGGLSHIVTSWAPLDWQPLALLAGVYLLTTVLTEVLSNNATAVLLTSVSIGLAQSMELDPRPFLVAIAIAASASFATPIGYQTNTYVYGAGGYRFMDFCKIGIPLNVLSFIVAMVMIPIFWKF